MMKLLVCGSRMKNLPREKILATLDQLEKKDLELIEGCCVGSADEVVEAWAREQHLTLNHYPGHRMGYLKRNVKMVLACDQILAFWDGYSYGTAQTIAQGVMCGKIVRVVPLTRKDNEGVER